MNALWLERMSRYRNSDLRIRTAACIIDLKIRRRAILLKKHNHSVYNFGAIQPSSINGVLLYEARAAKYFWKQYRKLLPKWTAFTSRQPQSKDVTNTLLDIGYHHLTNVVKKVLTAKEIPTELGLIHVANRSSSAPLVYDLVELFRADIVDAEVLRFCG